MDQREVNRRAVLGSTAAVLTGLAGCLGDASNTDEPNDGDDTANNDTTNDSKEGSNETDSEEENLDPPEGGAVVFVYDDGPMEDYTKAFPVHQEFDAPATIGIVSDWIGRDDYQSNGCMGVEHLNELVGADWEIASHTVEHTPVGTFELVEDADPEDEQVYPEQIRHGYHKGITLEIVDTDDADDNGRTVHRTVTDYGTDDIGQYIEFDESVGESFAAGETTVRYPDDQMHESLEESKHELEDLGFEVDTLLAPYDNFDEYSREFVPEYYDGVANARHGERINDPDGFDPYRTRRDYFIEFTSREAVKDDLNEIAERGALGVFGAHTFKEEVSQDRIRETLEWIDERDIEVMTLREAITRFTDEGQ